MDPPQIYYTVGYYRNVANENDAEIAVFNGPNRPDHSALRLTSRSSTNGFASYWFTIHPECAGWYISKWDAGPLVIHPLDSCVYYKPPTTQIYYFRKYNEEGGNHIDASDFAIMGPNTVCTSQSLPFTLTCVTCGNNPNVSIGALKGIGIIWSCSPNISLPKI
jgi:hypothetical protein